MPVIFMGHGSPMNAIEENRWSQGFRALAKLLPRPKAILAMSAHWYVAGTFTTANERPETIHDFGGFPEELYRIQYPAPGSTDLARSDAGRLSHPSPDHYLPLLYVAGASDPTDPVRFPVTGFDLGSLSMRSVLLG